MARKKRYVAPNASVRVTVNTEKAITYLDGLNDRLHAAIRPAAQAGAQIIYDTVLYNLDSMLGKQRNAEIRGVLKDAIYQKYIPEQSSEGLFCLYKVSWNSAKAPHGGLVEYGHRQIYRTYFGKDGRFHTAVRPDKLEIFKSYAGSKIPKNVRDQLFYRSANPTIVPPVPFMRNALSRLDEAGKEVKRVLMSATKSTFTVAPNAGIPKL